MAAALPAVAVALLAACSNPVMVDRAEVVGTYVLYVQGTRDELILRADGRYRHVVPPRVAGNPRVTEGEWRLSSGTPTYLILEAFDPWWSPFETGPILYATFFERRRGVLRLVLADAESWYTKQ
jgi:hypothetical protein